MAHLAIFISLAASCTLRPALFTSA